MKAARLRLGAAVACALLCTLVGAAPTGASASGIVISQVYGGGGNLGATLKNDFIEVFNAGSSSASLSGWSVQYASAAGSTWQQTNLSGTLATGQYLLVQEAAGSGGTTDLPPPDVTGNIAMAAGAGKVALVNSTTTLAGTCPSGAVDLVGYGTTANCFEGSGPAPALGNTTAALRANAGCTDTDDNAGNFTGETPNPRNTASPLNACSGAQPTNPTITVGSSPLNPTPNTVLTVVATETPGTNPASTGETVNCDFSWAGLGPSAPLSDDGTNGDATAGDRNFTRQFTIPSATSPGMKAGDCTVSDAQGRSSSSHYAVNVVPMVTDVAPTISSNTPASGDASVALDANVGITFSEPVDVGAGWYAISCGTSGGHSAAVTGGPSSFLLNPDTDFAPAETCTVTITGSLVSDQDTDDPPNNVEGTPSWSFTTAAAPHVVVSQVYGGGGNSGATLKNDFIELYNRGTSPVSLNGWSVQYGSATGTTWQVTNLTNFALQPGQHYLIQEAQGAGGTTNLPTPDAVGTIAMSATAGKVALVNTTTALSGACPLGPAVLDLVGYGTTANCAEGAAPTATLSNTTAALRKGGGSTDTDNNAADFDIVAPDPRNSGTGDDAPAVITRNPASGAGDVAVDSNVTIGFSEPVDVTGSWYSISCGTSGSHTAAVSGGPMSFTLDPDANFAAAETCTVTVLAANVTDQDTNDPPDNMAGNDTWSFSTVAPAVAIHDIQGATHVSPKAGQIVSNVAGVVTAKRSNGYYMQDPNPDADEATSEGIFVFTSSSPTGVSVGDAVRVTGRVQEFRPGGSSSANLSTTELVSPTTTVLSTGNTPPAPGILGTGGRIPPNQVIEDDAASGDVETSGVFDPATDGLDFYESVEGMRVQLNNAVAVGPTNSFGETPVVADNGANAGVRTARGGVLLRSDDGNPERLIADDVIASLPSVNVGDGYSGPLVGVIDYNFGNFFLEVTNSVDRVDNGLTREVTDPVASNEVSVATFNFENLAATNQQSKFDQLAGLIVNNLRSPDIVAGEEVQDNNGAVDDGTVDPTQTLSKLVAAIQAAGGPTYAWRQINSVNDQDGGEPGGNIRQVILFRTDRGVSFVDRPGGTSTNATGVTGTGSATQLTFSPGRIEPTNSAWNSSRKPLAAELTFRGHKLFLVVNHFNSKGGDQPLMGHFQPPTRGSETQRHQQAQLVANFVSGLTAANPDANVIVLGDLNDFEFSETAGLLKAVGLHDLIETLPLNERYSYEFEGNAQVLDHILVSGALFGTPFAFDAVHVNAEFASQVSDHDPSVARFPFNEPPTASADGPYTVAEGGAVTLAASGTDPEGGPLTYAWDLDDNGTFETSGQTPTFSAAALDGPATRTVAVRVTDSGGLTATDAAQITIANVAPSASFTAPASSPAGFDFLLSLTSPTDPSAADTAAGFTYAFDCGNGYGDFGSASEASCETTDVGTRSVGAKIRDKDGGVSEYHASVSVFVTYESLCELVKVYASSDPQVADVLCAKLAEAQDAATATARAGNLSAFRNQVDAKTGTGEGKAFTAAQAAELNLLATRLS